MATHRYGQGTCRGRFRAGVNLCFPCRQTALDLCKGGKETHTLKVNLLASVTARMHGHISLFNTLSIGHSISLCNVQPGQSTLSLCKRRQEPLTESDTPEEEQLPIPWLLTDLWPLLSLIKNPSSLLEWTRPESLRCIFIADSVRPQNWEEFCCVLLPVLCSECCFSLCCTVCCTVCCVFPS